MCINAYVCVWISIQISMRFLLGSWQNFRTIWKRFIGVIVVIVASRSLYSRFMSFPFASLSKKSFCWSCFQFSWIHVRLTAYYLLFYYCLQHLPARVDSNFLRQTNGLFSLAFVYIHSNIFFFFRYCFWDEMQTLQLFFLLVWYIIRTLILSLNILLNADELSDGKITSFPFASILLYFTGNDKTDWANQNGFRKKKKSFCPRKRVGVFVLSLKCSKFAFITSKNVHSRCCTLTNQFFKIAPFAPIYYVSWFFGKCNQKVSAENEIQTNGKVFQLPHFGCWHTLLDSHRTCNTH